MLADERADVNVHAFARAAIAGFDQLHNVIAIIGAYRRGRFAIEGVKEQAIFFDVAPLLVHGR